MAAIKAYWRTITVVVALIMVLAAIIYIPTNNSKNNSGNDNNGNDNGGPNDPNNDDGSHDTDRVAIQLLPPPDGKCYLSVGFIYHEGTQNISKDLAGQLDSFSTMVGKNQSVLFDVWGDMWDPNETYWQLDNYKPLLQEGKIKAIGLNVWPCVRADSYEDNYTVKKIANGTEDSFIIQQAKKVKEFGYPVFIRFGAEFNIYQGKTYQGQAQNQTFIFGENPTDFVNAWRHYVNVFREQNATNAIFVWNPNFADFGDHHWTEYYPGDSYVDWVGMDLYQYTNESDPASMMREIYNEYSAKKPIAVVEWGTNWPNVNISDNTRASFIKKFFDAVESMPQIKMVNYWYFQDFKFDPTSEPNTTAEYRSRISDARYI